MMTYQPRASASLALCLTLLSACGGGVPAPQLTDVGARTATATPTFTPRMDLGPATDDVVVIAVIDSGINPYHFDYLGAHMPQHLDEDPSNDLPLNADPSTWVSGYPDPSEFNRYFDINLTLTPDDPSRSTQELHDLDAAEWAKVAASTGTDNADVNMYWFPGTKIIGHVVFSGGDSFAPSSHGIGSASVSTGNIYGACPNCLLVFVHGPSERANEWVAQQDWIDLQTNSWGISVTPNVRTRIYAGSDTELQKTAIERGQQIFFSAGNGQANTFTAPNTTLQSSQEGPDWIVTVGAISPANGSSYSGHGKPADIASIGSGYPAGRGQTTAARGSFSGTSNATPVVAGMYGEALYRIRRMLAGPSRIQQDGVIAVGPGFCGAANPDCALADGQLTVHELRRALFDAAEYTGAGTNVAGLVTLPQTENIAELEFLSEGHGSFYGRLRGDELYLEELDRITTVATGERVVEMDPDARDWYIADSWCRQQVWGTWEHGEDQLGPVPPPSPLWPVRSFLTEACPSVIGALVAVEREL